MGGARAAAEAAFDRDFGKLHVGHDGLVIVRDFHAALGDADAAIGDEAIVRVEGDPGLWMFEARMALWRRDRDVAARLLASIPPTLDALAPRLILELVVTTRLPPEAEAFLVRSRATEGTSRRRSFYLQIEVEVSAFLGDTPHVLERVERAADAGLLDVVWLERCPLLDAYRGQPRFMAAYARVKQRADEILAAYRSP